VSSRRREPERTPWADDLAWIVVSAFAAMVLGLVGVFAGAALSPWLPPIEFDLGAVAYGMCGGVLGAAGGGTWFLAWFLVAQPAPRRQMRREESR
jgi:hypothetical protein